VIWVPVTGWIWCPKSADKNTPKQSWGSQVPLITQVPKTKISYPKHNQQNKRIGLLGGSNLGTNSVLVPKMIPHPSKTHNLGPRKSFTTKDTHHPEKPACDQKIHPRHPKKNIFTENKIRYPALSRNPHGCDQRQGIFFILLNSHILPRHFCQRIKSYGSIKPPNPSQSHSNQGPLFSHFLVIA
jgi:hypothetical protein